MSLEKEVQMLNKKYLPYVKNQNTMVAAVLGNLLQQIENYRALKEFTKFYRTRRALDMYIGTLKKLEIRKQELKKDEGKIFNYYEHITNLWLKKDQTSS